MKIELFSAKDSVMRRGKLCAEWKYLHIRHLFMYLAASFMSSLEDIFLYVNFKTNFKFVCFSILTCTSSMYVLDINPLPDRWFTNIFSHSIVCHSCFFNVNFLTREHRVFFHLLVLFNFFYDFQEILVFQTGHNMELKGVSTEYELWC